MSEKHKKTCKYLNYFSLNSYRSHFNYCICFIGLCCCWYYEFCSMNKDLCKLKIIKSVIKKTKKEHDKIVLLGEYKLNTVEVLLSKALLDSYISINF